MCVPCKLICKFDSLEEILRVKSMKLDIYYFISSTYKDSNKF